MVEQQETARGPAHATHTWAGKAWWIHCAYEKSCVHPVRILRALGRVLPATGYPVAHRTDILWPTGRPWPPSQLATCLGWDFSCCVWIGGHLGSSSFHGTAVVPQAEPRLAVFSPPSPIAIQYAWPNQAHLQRCNNQFSSKQYLPSGQQCAVAGRSQN